MLLHVQQIYPQALFPQSFSKHCQSARLPVLSPVMGIQKRLAQECEAYTHEQFCQWYGRHRGEAIWHERWRTEHIDAGHSDAMTDARCSESELSCEKGEESPDRNASSSLSFRQGSQTTHASSSLALKQGAQTTHVNQLASGRRARMPPRWRPPKPSPTAQWA